MPSGRPGNIKLPLIFASGKVFGVALVLIFMALINYLSLPISGNETKCCFEPFFPGESGMASCLVKLRKKTFLVGFVVRLIMMVTSFGIALFPLLLNFATVLSPSSNEQGSHELASLPPLAWLASWADFSDCWSPLGHCF